VFSLRFGSRSGLSRLDNGLCFLSVSSGGGFLAFALLFSICVSFSEGKAAGRVVPGLFDFADLPELDSGGVGCRNALWIETDLNRRFHSQKEVVVAQIEGPAIITMIHFALPQSHFVKKPRRLGRDVLLQVFWDGEKSPSVNCPLVDFFCDPAGLREEVGTALVNKRRGFNAYFPMPFRRSATVKLLYDGPVAPGPELWRLMPCYSYVLYRKVETLSPDTGYFHAWRHQEGLLLGKRDYLALEARGRGKFVGWNVTIRRPGSAAYPVDENEKFYVDGAAEPTIEFMGLEDSFGFSWGFPSSECFFPLTGFFPFYKGAAAYRFFINDAIAFSKSLRVTIGFGKNENPLFHRQYSKKGSELELSSVVYWYQTEPHASPPPHGSSLRDKSSTGMKPLHGSRMQAASPLEGRCLQGKCLTVPPHSVGRPATHKSPITPVQSTLQGGYPAFRPQRRLRFCLLTPVCPVRRLPGAFSGAARGLSHSGSYDSAAYKRGKRWSGGSGRNLPPACIMAFKPQEGGLNREFTVQNRSCNRYHSVLLGFCRCTDTETAFKRRLRARDKCLAA